MTNSRVSALLAHSAVEAEAKDILTYWHAKIVGDFNQPAMEVLARQLDPSSDRYRRIKSAVEALSVGSLGGSLAYQQLATPFLTSMQRETVPGQLPLLPAPANARFPIVTSMPTAAWIREGYPIPATMLELDLAYSDTTKLATIYGISAEWLRIADERSVALFGILIRRVVRDMVDAAFLDDQAGVAQERPQGLLYGVTAIGGGSPSSLSDELAELWRSVSDGEPDRPYFVLGPKAAIYLASQNVNGTPLFPQLGPLGGAIYGVPAIVSKGAGANLILLDAAKIALSDDGMTVEGSNASAIQMNDSPSPGPANLVSSFQGNVRFVKVVRYINWTIGSDDAVGFIELPIGSPV